MTRLYDIETLSELLALSPATIRRWSQRGEFCQPLMLPRAVRWAEDDVAAWIKSRKESSLSDGIKILDTN